jgi:PAS domain S-box-containing protein
LHEQRINLLLELSAGFSKSLTPDQIADVVVKQALKSLGAHISTVVLLVEQDTQLEILNLYGLPQETIEKYRRTPLEMSGPLNDAVRTGNLVWLETMAQYTERYPQFAETIQRNGSHSTVCIPLKVNEKTIGGFSLSFPTEKPHTPNEEIFFMALAQLCAQALDRTQLGMLLENQRQWLANVIATVPGVIWENHHTDEREEMKLIFISAYVETMLGYTVEEALSEPHFWLKIFHPEDAQKTAEAFNRVRQSGGSGVINFRAIHKSGRVLDIQALMTTIIKDGQAVGKRGVMMDVSERQSLMNAQVSYAAMLRRSNEELQQFAYVASHDLQEPLRTITSYLQLLEQRYEPLFDQDAREFIGFAVDGATRMKALIQDLLLYSRVRRNEEEVKPFSTQEALNLALSNLRTKIRESQAQVKYDNLPTIVGNKNQFVQLFQNLISNAIKFHGDQPPQIYVRATRDTHEWVFTVQDNGIGIEPEYLERIFVMFQRLHPIDKYKGSGIGLAICKKVVEYHQGRIWAESKFGEGTTFFFTIPTSNNGH